MFNVEMDASTTDLGVHLDMNQPSASDLLRIPQISDMCNVQKITADCCGRPPSNLPLSRTQHRCSYASERRQHIDQRPACADPRAKNVIGTNQVTLIIYLGHPGLRRCQRSAQAGTTLGVSAEHVDSGGGDARLGAARRQDVSRLMEPLQI
jgi:hypothetical protein